MVIIIHLLYSRPAAPGAWWPNTPSLLAGSLWPPLWKLNSESSALFLLSVWGQPVVLLSLLQGVSPQKRPGELYCLRQEEWKFVLLTHPLGLSDLLHLSESARQGGHRLIVCPEAWKRTGQIKNTCSHTVKYGSNQSMCLASSSPGLQPAVWSPLLGPEGWEQGGPEQVGQGLGVEDSRGFFSRLTFAC